MESQAKSHDKETSPMLSRTCYQKLRQNWGGGGGAAAWGRGLGLVTRQSFIRGGTAPRSNPLPFYIPFSADKVPFSSVPSIDRWCPFHNTQFRILGIFTLLNTNESQNQEIFSTLSQP